MKVKIIEQERFKQTKMNFTLGKNGRYQSSGLGGRLIVVVSPSDDDLVVYEILKICSLNRYAIELIIIDIWLHFESNSNARSPLW